MRDVTAAVRREECSKPHDPEPFITEGLAMAQLALRTSRQYLSPRPEFCQKPSHYVDYWRHLKRTSRGWKYRGL